MLYPQNNYDFKKELLEIHKKDVFDPNVLPSKSEFVFDNDCKIVLLDQSQVILTAVRDFEDYLFTSMNVSVSVVNGGNIKDSQKAVIISINKNLEKANGYMGYKISVTRRRVKIEGFDERGIAQALYYLEDRMNVKKAPYLSRGVTERKALFSPRIVQSPFGMFSYPDEAFSIMAHRGFDAIDVWIKDAYTDKRG